MEFGNVVASRLEQLEERNMDEPIRYPYGDYLPIEEELEEYSRCTVEERAYAEQIILFMASRTTPTKSLIQTLGSNEYYIRAVLEELLTRYEGSKLKFSYQNRHNFSYTETLLGFSLLSLEERYTYDFGKVSKLLPIEVYIADYVFGFLPRSKEKIFSMIRVLRREGSPEPDPVLLETAIRAGMRFSYHRENVMERLEEALNVR